MKLIETDNKINDFLGTIGFSKLKISCIIGVEEVERLRKQDILVDLEVKYDISSCVPNDSIENAIDYVQLSKICKQIAEEGKFQLIETYVYEVLNYLHHHFPILHSKIRVEKPSALPKASCSFVELERSK